jgi:hypothetical protein
VLGAHVPDPLKREMHILLINLGQQVSGLLLLFVTLMPVN